MSLISNAIKTAQRERTGRSQTKDSAPLIDGFFPYVSTTPSRSRSRTAPIVTISVGVVALLGVAAWAVMKSLDKPVPTRPIVLPQPVPIERAPMVADTVVNPVRAGGSLSGRSPVSGSVGSEAPINASGVAAGTPDSRKISSAADRRVAPSVTSRVGGSVRDASAAVASPGSAASAGGAGTAAVGTAGPGTSGSGTAAVGTAAVGTAGPGTSGFGTAASGTAASGTAASGTAASGTARDDNTSRSTAARNATPAAPRIDHEAQATALFNAGDLVAARDKFLLAVRSAPSARAWTNYGVTLQRLGDDAGATAAYQAAVGLDANYLEAWLYQGRIAAQRGDVGRAVPLLERARAINPRNADVNIELARLEFDAKNWTESRRFGEEAVRGDPTNPRGHWYVAVSSDQLKDVEAAISAYTAYLQTIGGSEREQAQFVGWARTRLAVLKGKP